MTQIRRGIPYHGPRGGVLYINDVPWIHTCRYISIALIQLIPITVPDADDHLLFCRIHVYTYAVDFWSGLIYRSPSIDPPRELLELHCR